MFEVWSLAKLYPLWFGHHRFPSRVSAPGCSCSEGSLLSVLLKKWQESLNLVAHLPRPQDQGCSYGEVPNSPSTGHGASPPMAELTSQSWTDQPGFHIFPLAVAKSKVKTIQMSPKMKTRATGVPFSGWHSGKTRRWICNVDVFGKSAAPDTSGLCPAQECRNAISHVKFYRNNENPSFCRPCLQEYSLWQHSEISCFLPQTQIPQS